MEYPEPSALRFVVLDMSIPSARLSLLALCLAGTIVSAQESAPRAKAMTAFEAGRLLSDTDQKSLAVIAGRDGTPTPERWHILVHDPTGEVGLREFVIADRKVVASRFVSQFAETLTKESVITNPLIVDSDDAARMAQVFCRTNCVIAATLHYELRKEGPAAPAMWTITCLNAAGAELGRIVISAERGTIVLHPGFVAEPTPAQLLDQPRPAPMAISSGKPESARSKPAPQPELAPAPRPKAATPAPKTNFFQRVFGGAGR